MSGETMKTFPLPDYFKSPAVRRHKPAQPAADAAQRVSAQVERLSKLYAESPGAASKLAAAESGDPLAADLSLRGLFTTTIPSDAKAQLVRETSADIELLDARVRDFPKDKKLKLSHTQHVFDPEQRAPLYALCSQILNDMGVIGATLIYNGAPVRMNQVTLQLSTADSTARTYGALDEDYLPAGHRAAYLHIDSAVWPSTKVLIYLTHVGVENGPFRYCEGTHRSALEERIIRKANDIERLPLDDFLSLPEPLRHHTLFGSHITDDHPDLPDLLARETIVTSDKGDLICFDFDGAHRGGFVAGSLRAMLQISFVPDK